MNPTLELASGSEDARDIAAARGGDQAAFAALYHRYARMVHGMLLARVPREAVDDLVQDVFLMVYRRLDSLRDPGAFGGWLAQITRNRAHDYHRRSPQSQELHEHMLIAPASEDRLAEDALEAVRNLPEAYRETLILRLVEGMSGAEIAERTGLTPASVRVNLHRGMKLLREKLGGGR
ncbi:MAG: sigma-70 family RNA polymerase sigma factor [Acidobacteria bacterium]|nr:sigma-70 family RNA polymerase sigma factor [Acidobacteriota bacterium]MBI3471356.1 sigma-70 family RNA polymerase sigma factor [Candidatus Solibacter usitatus]